MMPRMRPGVAPYGQRAQGPGAEFKRGMQQMLAFLQRGPEASPDQLAAFIEQEIAPYFDFEYMAKTALGPRHRGMSAEQRAATTQRLKRSFLNTLTEKLSGYGGQGMQFIGSRTNPDGRTATVNVAIANPGTYPARLTFRMYKGKRGWKVYDVTANGQSAVMHYRRQLNQSAPAMRGPGGRPPMSSPMRGYR
jgi:phospholipid transport system substrate-binding protein